MNIVPLTPLRAGGRTAAAQHREAEAEPGASNGRVAVARKRRAEAKPAQSYGLAHALDSALQETPVGETLFVIPTYTGLLEVHRELERRGLTPHYWEEKGP
jgi:lipid II isoglutaminyl synthase (glutamine-hydrolysing)